MACLVAAGCAKEGAPGGGPLDTFPPSVASHSPAAGEVDVDPAVKVELEFSEKMDRQTVEEALVVLPPRAGQSLKWKGRRLLVEGDAFPGATTCVVTVLGTCRDSHGNPLGAAHTWAFSTGNSLATGCLQVDLESQGSPVVGGLVWAAKPEDTTGVATRVGQADSTGSASVGWLEAGTYHVRAFRDVNMDLEYQFGSEEAAEDTVALSPGDTVSLQLTLAVADTTPPMLLRAFSVSSRRVDLIMSEAVEGEGEYSVVDEIGDSLPIRYAYIDPEQAGVVHLVFNKDMASTQHRASATGLIDGVGLSLVESEAEFEGTSDPDVVPPDLRTVYVYADSGNAGAEQVWVQLRLVWTEPVTVPNGTVTVLNVVDGLPVAGDRRELNPQETVWIAAGPVDPDAYLVVRVSGVVTDLEGNACDQSLIALVGPETAEVPIVSLPGQYVSRGGSE